MVRWTDWMVRHRKKVLAAWLVILVVGGMGAAGLGDLLSNRFSVPGSEAERGRTILSERFGEKGDGNFTLVVEATRGTSSDPALRAEARSAARRAAAEIPGARVSPVQRASREVAFVQIRTPLEAADAAEKTEPIREAIGSVEGANTYLSGFPAIGEDTEKIYNEDLAQGEMIAVPVAILVLAFMFGTLAGISVPLLFAAVTIPTTLGVVWIFANFMDMAVYVTNIVTLIGIAIAIDYSMLVVFRYREELRRGEEPRQALRRTMSTAGRATVFSGLVVALGLALLVFMPLPFMRSMGVGGMVIPLVSIAAATTFLPALLAVMGSRVNRLRIVPRAVLERRAQGEGGMWTRLAHSIMRRPLRYFAASAALMVGLALFATGIDVGSGDNRGVPRTVESTKGLTLLEDTLGAGALSPHQLVVDTGRAGGAFSRESREAQRRFVRTLRGDREVQPSTIQAPALAVRGPGPPSAGTREEVQQAGLVDSSGRYLQIRAAGRSDSAREETVELVERMRDHHIPAAGFHSDEVFLSGAPAFGVDVMDKAYSAFPWLVVAVLVLSYLLLLRAFRSLVLPVKAVLMNLLSVGATYGVLVLVFDLGLGAPLGFETLPQIEFWIPIFLFAMLFGLSMDYEVFLLSRVREEWEQRRDNEAAVAYGLEHTGRIITAAAIIMVAAFSGFMFGSFPGLQQFGVGLAAAIFLDATVVRAILVPATMKLLGRWNWYLPERLRRALRLAPGPAAPGEVPVR